ncbi:MAG: 1-deoxy-D-xylulose-5-phosphate reductoisomerase [Burkholderiales bacterium]|nr:1-deoxy-D-xylulose-5-phosphate reductoisomerase [Burkholderiales bacterium]
MSASESGSPARVCILGATGSIGMQTLDIVRRHPSRFVADTLVAHRNVAAMTGLCRDFEPRVAVMADADAAGQLADTLRGSGIATAVRGGAEAVAAAGAAAGVDTVVAGIVGAAGLAANLAAARAGKRILLANKEALVMTGPLFMAAVRDHGATLLPIDSEHNAVFQVLPEGRLVRGVRKVWLTCSGGPFRDLPELDLATVTPEQACKHPNWSMGRKISVDSATLMNKGLEVIEAHWLFGAPAEDIEVVIHPQSIVHSMVEYDDGSILAQLGNPDMRTPIAHALAWPERIEAGVAPLDLVAMPPLTFGAPDRQRFPCLGLAYEALRLGGTAPAVLNAANEVAVAAFLEAGLRFTEIPRIIEAVLAAVPVVACPDLAAVLQADGAAREIAARMSRGNFAR